MSWFSSAPSTNPASTSTSSSSSTVPSNLFTNNNDSVAVGMEGFSLEDLPPSMQKQQQQQQQQQQQESTIGGLPSSLVTGIGQQIAGNVWSAGKESAEKAYGTYAKIDILRPYFEVEPAQVKSRLLRSFLPTRTSRDVDPIPTEMYGPLMLVLSLVTVLLFGMKYSDAKIREGTLMGAALAVSFGYWFSSSAFFFFFAYIFNTAITFLQILHLTGYGLLSYCIVLLLATMFPQTWAFHIAWMTFGGLSSLKIAVAFFNRTVDRKQGFIVGGIVFGVHWFYLFYLFRAYHLVIVHK